MKYQIVLVPFPFDDFSGTKVRPAVCLTNKIGKFNHIVIAFITSQPPSDKTESDVILEHSAGTGLKITSYLRLHRLITIPFEIILRHLGKIPENKEEEIKQKLSLLFGINPGK